LARRRRGNGIRPGAAGGARSRCFFPEHPHCGAHGSDASTAGGQELLGSTLQLAAFFCRSFPFARLCFTLSFTIRSIRS